MPPDRGWVEFTLNPKAKFSDGQPVTIDDVIFSLELLRDNGRPNTKAYYSKVERIERIGDRGVRFHFENAHDRELPLILGLMPVLPKHGIDPEKFEQTTLTPIIGSGPYIPSEIKAPDLIVYKRDPDYWAKDLPAKRGFDNYDEIRIEYYRDVNTMFEAFKKGLYDVNPDGDPSHWNTAYNFPALTDGRVVKEAFKTGTPKGMAGFVFNTRRPIFADIRVRDALAKLFDFEWVNKNYFYGAYARCGSYFGDSELSALGRPADERGEEAAGALPRRGQRGRDERHLPADRERRQRRRPQGAPRSARKSCRGPGYELRGNALVNTATGTPLTFEILVSNKDDERLALAYQRTLARVGIRARCPLDRLLAVPAAAQHVRLRHDPLHLAGVAVARQRAAFPLEPGVGRRRTARSTMPAPSSRQSTP